MAGIGWKLQRLIDRGSLAGTIGAYLTGVAVTSAPWLLTTAVLTIKDFVFGVPASVAPGATVTVTNADTEAHTVTSKDGGFDVKVGGRGGTATFTAPSARGRYQLTCDFHADMSGVLVVS